MTCVNAAGISEGCLQAVLYKPRGKEEKTSYFFIGCIIGVKGTHILVLSFLNVYQFEFNFPIRIATYEKQEVGKYVGAARPSKVSLAWTCAGESISYHNLN